MEIKKIELGSVVKFSLIIGLIIGILYAVWAVIIMNILGNTLKVDIFPSCLEKIDPLLKLVLLAFFIIIEITASFVTYSAVGVIFYNFL